MATISPRPTTTSEAATAITEIANTWPASPPCSRDIAIRSRFAAFSMISTESRMISGFRRIITPSAPVANSNALRITYHWMSGPCIGLQARVGAEHHAADGRDEQDDRRDLEGEQMIGEEGAAELLRRAERAADVVRLREEAARLQPDDDADLGEDRPAGEHR